jgi:hypothetical protein
MNDIQRKRVAQIVERWKYVLMDRWSKFDQNVTGHGAAVFVDKSTGHFIPGILPVIKRDGYAPGRAVVVCAVPDTAPVIYEMLIHAPEDIAFLLSLLPDHSQSAPERRLHIVEHEEDAMPGSAPEHTEGE